MAPPTGQDAVLAFSEAGLLTRFESSGLVSFFCPEKNATLDMRFTLETDPAKGAASPIYVG
jgi:hypothetical protein